MSTQSSAKAVLRHAEHPWQSDVLVSDEYTSFATMQESARPATHPNCCRAPRQARPHLTLTLTTHPHPHPHPHPPSPRSRPPAARSGAPPARCKHTSRRTRRRSMIKVASWRCLGSAAAPPQGAPGGSGQLGASRKRSGHSDPHSLLQRPSRCLWPPRRSSTVAAPCLSSGAALAGWG